MHPLLNLLSEVTDKTSLIYQELIKQYLKDEFTDSMYIESLQKSFTFENFFKLNEKPESRFYLVKFNGSEFMDYVDNSIIDIETMGRVGPIKINDNYSLVWVVGIDIFYIILRIIKSD